MLVSDDDEQSAEKSYSAPALEKGLDILECLAEGASALSLRDLAERLARSKNEIFRMTHVLIARGYVQRDPDTDELSLTNKLFALGLQTPQTRTLLEVALPEMKKLAEEVDQAPHLVVVHKGRTVIIGHIPTNSDVTFNLHLGYGRPSSEATTGKVIMAFQTEEKRKLMVGDCERYAGISIDQDHLESTLDRIRATGHVLGKSTDFVGITDICCPVLDAEGHAVASIIVPHVERINETQDHTGVLAALTRACQRIGSRL